MVVLTAPDPVSILLGPMGGVVRHDQGERVSQRGSFTINEVRAANGADLHAYESSLDFSVKSAADFTIRWLEKNVDKKLIPERLFWLVVCEDVRKRFIETGQKVDARSVSEQAMRIAGMYKRLSNPCLPWEDLKAAKEVKDFLSVFAKK